MDFVETGQFSCRQETIVGGVEIYSSSCFWIRSVKVQGDRARTFLTQIIDPGSFSLLGCPLRNTHGTYDDMKEIS